MNLVLISLSGISVIRSFSGKMPYFFPLSRPYWTFESNNMISLEIRFSILLSFCCFLFGGLLFIYIYFAYLVIVAISVWRASVGYKLKLKVFSDL